MVGGIRHPLPYSLRQNSAVHAVMYHQAGAKSIALNLMLSLSLFFFFPSSTCTECNMFTQARRQKMLRAKFSLTQGQIIVSQSLNQQLDTKSFHNHILGTITNCFISNLLEALTLFLKWEGVYVVVLGNPLTSWTLVFSPLKYIICDQLYYLTKPHHR